MPGSRILRFDHALTPEGWQRDVAVAISPDGTIASVDAGSTDGEHIAGAAIPGVANLHCHAFQRAFAGLTEQAGLSDDSFWTWRERMYAFLSRMEPEDAEAVAAFAYMEMLESGFTTVAEFHYLHHRPDGSTYANPAEMAVRHVAAADETGIGLTMLPVFYAHGGFGGTPATPGQRRFINTPDGFARLVEKTAEACAGRPGMRVGIAPHSLRAVTPAELRIIDTLLPAAPRHVHVSEQTKEVEDCLAAHGVTPIRLLADSIELTERWCLIHATHATPEELTLIATTGAVAGLCPITEANLGDGVFPAAAFQAQGGRYGVGSDSNVLISLVEELRILEYGQRLTARRRNVLAGRSESTGSRLFGQVLAGGAQACGSALFGMSAGAPADIVVLDTVLPEFTAATPGQFLDIWTFGFGGRAVTDVFTRGRHVVAGGRHRQRQRHASRFREVVKRLAEG